MDSSSACTFIFQRVKYDAVDKVYYIRMNDVVCTRQLYFIDKNKTRVFGILAETHLGLRVYGSLILI